MEFKNLCRVSEKSGLLLLILAYINTIFQYMIQFVLLVYTFVENIFIVFDQDSLLLIENDKQKVKNGGVCVSFDIVLQIYYVRRVCFTTVPNNIITHKSLWKVTHYILTLYEVFISGRHPSSYKSIL